VTAQPITPAATLAGLPVVSTGCENARRQLMIALAQHRRAEAALESHVFIGGRLKVLPPGSMQAQHRREGLLVRCVTIVESYVAGQLVVRLTPKAPSPRAALVEQLYAEFEDKGTGSWPAMGDYFSKYVAKDIKIRNGASPFAKVGAIIEARNALVHGLGRFTARQVRSKGLQQTKQCLKVLKYDLTPDGSGVVVTHAAIEESVTALRAYLEWVDSELSAHAPL
jgi:hypothetical protein